MSCLICALVDFGQILAGLGDEQGCIRSISISKAMVHKGKSLWGAVAEKGTRMGCYFGGSELSECVCVNVSVYSRMCLCMHVCEQIYCMCVCLLCVSSVCIHMFIWLLWKESK